MTKRAFIDRLKARLSTLPKKEANERLTFYSEMIDDRVEDGITEAQAVAELGSVKRIADEIIADRTSENTYSKSSGRKRWGSLGITLLILGSPIWLSLIIAAFAVVVSLFAVIWSLVISLWAIFASVVACGVGGVVGGIVFAFTGNVVSGIALIGAGIALFGFAVLFFFGCRAATKGTVLLTPMLVSGIRKCFIK